MADIERALGRPERAIELTRGPEVGELNRSQAIELAIVAAGARRDLGELDAAVVGLQLPELDPARRDPWSPRLFYAYADNLLAAGRTSEAVAWFVHTTDVDDEGDTDAAARLAELTGDPVPDDADDVVFVEQEADAPEVEVSGAGMPNAEVEVAEVEAADVEAPDVEAVAPVPREVPGSAADPVSDAAAGPDVAAGAEHPLTADADTGAMTDDPQ
jgi:hypothetical protein